jgi:frataxin-like iron-binding protein CyaY
MKDIKKIIGKTIKDVIYDGDRDMSDLTIKFEDGTEIIIATEYNAPNM